MRHSGRHLQQPRALHMKPLGHKTRHETSEPNTRQHRTLQHSPPGSLHHLSLTTQRVSTCAAKGKPHVKTSHLNLTCTYGARTRPTATCAHPPPPSRADRTNARTCQPHVSTMLNRRRPASVRARVLIREARHGRLSRSCSTVGPRRRIHFRTWAGVRQGKARHVGLMRVLSGSCSATRTTSSLKLCECFAR